MISARLLKFVGAGGIAAALNFGSRIVLGQWLSYTTSIVLAYLIGMATAFILNRLFVFRTTTTALQKQIGWFVLVNVAAVLQTLAISVILARWVLPGIGVEWHNETLAHAVGVAVPVITSYIGHKYLTFR